MGTSPQKKTIKCYWCEKEIKQEPILNHDVLAASIGMVYCSKECEEKHDNYIEYCK